VTLDLETGRHADLRRRAESLFPGGVNSPVRAFRSVGRPPLILEAGQAARVRDADGAWYLDYIGAWGPAILGHGQPDVVEAVREAALDGFALGATSPREVGLAERIQDAMPSMERLRFTSSGTEAVMSAIRLARGATARDLVVKFAGGYHGHGDSMLVEAGSGLATLAMPGSAGVTEAAARDTVVLPYNDPRAVADAFERHGDAIAAVIVEPVAANVGVVPPAAGFLEHLREVTAAHGSVLVFDEVITGFRVARGGAQGRFAVTPDLTSLGKIIGGGMPIGAYGGRADLMRHVAPEGPVYQAGTLSGHPLAMAAGAATLDRLTPAVYERLESTGAALEAGLRTAARDAGRAVAITRVGSLLTVFFRASAPRDGTEALTSDREAYARFFGAMLDAGILLPPSQFEAWFVGAAHGEAEVAETVLAARRAFAA
jgi:glutamate-1-semialdehyde 2,1-aminomutase